MAPKRKDLERRSKQNFDRPMKKTTTGIRTDTDPDDDFEMPLQTYLESIKKPEKEFKDYLNNRLKLRCSPYSFMESIKTYTDAQKAAVESMGFGPILTMDVDSIPTALGYWLLVNFDESTRILNMGHHKIKITASRIHDVFGIPIGKVTVLEKNKPRKGSHSTIDEFKNQFDTTRITIGTVIPIMEQQINGGRLFKLNFLVVWNTVFGEITKSTTINQRFLLGIDDESEIPHMNWCSYLLECLVRTKASWKGIDEQYNGPVAMLSILYTHEFNKKHKASIVKTPAISYIKTYELLDMESFLCDNGPLTDDEGEETNIFEVRNEGLDVTVNRTNVTDVSEPMAEPMMAHHTADENQLAASTEGLNVTVEKTKDVHTTNDTDVSEPIMLEPIMTHHEDEENNMSSSDEQQDFYIDMLKNIGPATQRFIDDCITQPELTGISAYVDPEQQEANKKARKSWLNRMDNNMAKFDAIVEEMDMMVQDGRTQYPWWDDLMKRCDKWEERKRGFNKPQEQEKRVEETSTPAHHVTEPETDEPAVDLSQTIEQILNSCAAGVDATEIGQQNVSTTPAGLNKTVGGNNEPESNVVINPSQDISDSMVLAMHTVQAGIYRHDTEEGATDIEAPCEGLGDGMTTPTTNVLQKKQRTTAGKRDDMGRGKRTMCLAAALKSPYVNRIVEITNSITSAEHLVSRYIFAPIDGSSFQTVYSSQTGLGSFKHVFETFYPGIDLNTNLIDVWAEILNFEEKKRDKNSPYRLFCTTMLMSAAYYSDQYDDNQRLVHFSTNMDDIRNKFDVKSMNSVDIIVVPILQHGHFYLICFQLKVGKIELIDNSRLQQDFKDRYGAVPEILQRIIYMYLKRHTKPAPGITRLEYAKISRVEMSWRTLHNKIDCGIFAMRHMETYKAKPQWKCGLLNESADQRRQLNELRYKYVGKILLSETNLVRDDLISEAKKFEKSEEKKFIMVDVRQKLLDRLNS